MHRCKITSKGCLCESPLCVLYNSRCYRDILVLLALLPATTSATIAAVTTISIAPAATISTAYIDVGNGLIKVTSFSPIRIRFRAQITLEESRHPILTRHAVL